MRIWFKEWKNSHMIKDMVSENNDTSLNRTHKVFTSVDEVCYAFDLSKPIWLDSTVEEFKRHNKARFYQDNFIDSIDFDYLEIEVIEED